MDGLAEIVVRLSIIFFFFCADGFRYACQRILVEKNRLVLSESLSGLRRLRTTFSHFFERSFSSLKKLRKEENGELMS
jgi:hypothetical protein